MAGIRLLIRGKVPEWIAALAAVGVYCSMYAFRKPFTMLSFDGLEYFGISYKVRLITAQLLGYSLSKLWGIRLISELTPNHRFIFLIKIISLAWISLLLFATVPPPYTLFIMFLNGIPLGLVWGVVFSYLEGRQLTDLMAALLASSFIFSSGLVKSVGSNFLYLGILPEWMPFVTGGFFFIPFLALLTLLNRISPPTEKDQELRTIRTPMNHSDRRLFWNQWGGLLMPLMIIYIFYTMLRDYRDNFSLELFQDFHIQDMWLISQTEFLISLVLLSVVAGFVLIRSHIRAIMYSHLLMIFGFILLFISSGLYQSGYWSGLSWYLATGLGVFAGYIPFNCILMDRLIAMIQVKGNVGFLMYVFDSLGYAGTILVLLIKEWILLPVSPSVFYLQMIYVLGLGGIVLILYSVFLHTRLFKVYA